MQFVKGPSYLDTLERKIQYYYSANPDSSIELNLELARICDSLGLFQKKFYAYMVIMEIYQYRKPDIVKAANYLAEAMKLFISKPNEVVLDNPYVFIDLGNVFNKFKMYSQSRKFYQLAFTLSKRIQDKCAVSLCMLNNAYSFKDQCSYDSALFYIKMSELEESNGNGIRVLQNNNLKAEIFIALKKYDSVKLILDKNLHFIAKLKKNQPEIFDVKVSRSKFAWHESISKTYELLCLFYNHHKMKDSTLRTFRYALAYADNSESRHCKARLFLIRILISGAEVAQDSVAIFADSLISVTGQLNDPQIIAEYSDSLMHYFQNCKMYSLSTRFKKISECYSDSLIRIRASNQMSETIITLASVAAENAYFQAEKESIQKTILIRQKNILLTGTILFILFILISLVYTVLQHQKLRHAYDSIIENIRERNKRKYRNSLPVDDDNDKRNLLKHNLENLMHEKSPFIDPDFSLGDLASLLNTSLHNTSQLLNQEYGHNFNEYINKYRVEIACCLLSDPENRNFSMIQLAEKSGFKSKSTFYRVFTATTGISPASFQKRMIAADSKLLQGNPDK